MDTTADDAATSGAAGSAATEGIDTEIYAMPGFVTLQVDDLARSTRWYVEGLGFVVLAEIPGPGGTPVLVHLRRHRYQDILLVARRPDVDVERIWGRGVRYSVRRRGGPRAAGPDGSSGRRRPGGRPDADAVEHGGSGVPGPGRLRGRADRGGACGAGGQGVQRHGAPLRPCVRWRWRGGRWCGRATSACAMGWRRPSGA